MVVHSEAPSTRALDEEDSLLNVRIEGELERDCPREDLAGVGEKRCLWWWCHTDIFDVTCDMSWGDTDVANETMPEHSLTDCVAILRPLATNDAPAWLAVRARSNANGGHGVLEGARQRVDNVSQIVSVRWSSLGRNQQQRFKEIPSGIGQIT